MIIMNFISRIKSLNKGNTRLLIAISIVLTILIAAVGIINNQDELAFFGLVFFFIFWLFVWLILWIKDGYKE